MGRRYHYSVYVVLLSPDVRFDKHKAGYGVWQA